MTNPPLLPPSFDIVPVTIEEEMRRSYLDYAMSVIVARALPDVRDGLKPVHRRILFSMKEQGYDWNKGYRKSARIVGDVIGKYHPHGDVAIYDAMVRMAQDFSMRLTLIDGQGNFGSMDGDRAAAMRYTEARLSKPADHLLRDIDRDTVSFQANYDNTEVEPTVLPAEFPNLLVNGAGGIAVGMATNIPPHNLGEVIDACIAYLDAPDIPVEALMQIMPGPDFPTGGIILGRGGIMDAYRSGRGSIVMRAKTEIETFKKDRQAIIVTEVPYQVNKAKMLEKIAELVNAKTIEGISDLRDESDRDGVRVVIELKRDASSDVVLNQLYRHTPLQSSFGVNMLAINGGRPEMMSLKEVIVAFCAFREEVVQRRTAYELRKARERGHVLAGLAIAVANIDDVIHLIRTAPDPVVAREQLMARDWPAKDVAPLIALIDDPDHKVADNGTYRLSEIQARAILDLRLQRLTGLEREKIAGELGDLGEQIKDYLDILANRSRVLDIIRGEMTAIKTEFATPRKTQIDDSEVDYDIEALIQREDMVVTVSHAGYIKRVALSSYRSQRRGGKGRAGMATREEDFVERVFVANTHTPVLFFTTKGRAFETKVWRLPESTPQGRGKPMVNLLPALQPGERIATVLPLPDVEQREGLTILFATSKGEVRRNALSDFLNIKSNGKIAMKLEDEDGNSLGDLIGVSVARDDQDVLLSTRLGKAIRFSVDDIRVFQSRASTGVRGIRLAYEDAVISMAVLDAVQATVEERDAYLRRAAALRRAAGDDAAVETSVDDEADLLAEQVNLTDDRFQELQAVEQFLLTVTERGFGKRSSAYEYRKTGRGGQGIAGMDITQKNGPVVGAFPVSESDQIMLVTDGGQLIRIPVAGIRIAGRKTQGVTLFKVETAERVVSVTRLDDTGEETEDGEGSDAPPADGAPPSLLV
ncbi:DNA gyrase subunit A [Elstera cyanobacteriorum]|uniref:DNA gyrase subunit A n=1 Tax=Elstera cyanobacteriorum TaxID=2022747 RepID=UPI002356287A|nr:DNA gyrase subunit A [Elstera cyanobacteriorum]